MTVDDPLHVYTGLRWHLDSNAVDDARIEPLVRCAELGWVRLSVGDQAHAEPMKNPAVYARLLPHPERFDVMFGGAIPDHSRLDMSTLESDQDAERFDLVFATLWPQRNREADGRGETREGGNRFRDAMHVDTAIRYGASGLVTQDEPMWAADARFRETFSGFRIVSIDEAIEIATKQARHVRDAASVHGRLDPATVPDWPT